jgi:hypothetical protein
MSNDAPVLTSPDAGFGMGGGVRGAAVTMMFIMTITTRRRAVSG